MTKNDINIKINIDGKDAVSGVNETSEALKKLGKSTNELEKSTTGATSSVDGTSKAVKELKKGADETTSSVDGTSNGLKKLKKDTDELEKSIAGVERGWKEAIIVINSSLDVLEKASRYAKSAFDSLKEGANYTEAKESFATFAKSLGANSDTIISGLRKASAGTISNKNLMLTASKALALGVTTDSEKMAKLLEIARSRARLFGLDTTQAFEDIVIGIGRAQPLILDNLGLRMPAGFKKMSQGMSDAEQVALLFKLTLEAGGKELESIGGLTLTTADKFRRLEAAVDDLSSEFKAELSESFVSLVDFARVTGIPVMKSGLNLVNDFVKAAKKLDEGFGAINLTLATTAGIMGGLALSSIFTRVGDITTAIKKANIAQKAFNASALLNPYVAIGALAGTSIYAGKIKWDEWGANKTTAKNEQILREQKTVPNLKRHIEELQIAIEDEYAINNLKSKMSNFQSLPEHSQVLVSSYMEGIRQTKDELTELEKKLEIISETRLKGVKTALEDVLGTAKETTLAYNSLSDSIERAYQSYRNGGTVEGLAKGLKSVYESAVSLLDNTGFGGNSFIVTTLENIAKSAAEAVNNFEDLSPHLDQFKKFGKSAEKAFSYLQSGLETYIKYTTPKEFSPSKWFGFDVIEKVYKSAGTNKTIKKTADTIHDEFRDAIADSVSDGFARADFSGFAESLRAGLRGVVGGALGDTINSLFKEQNMGSLVSGNGLFKQIYTKNASGKGTSLNWSALAGNVGIGLGLSFLTSDGGLLGKRKIIGAENINKSTELNAQVDQAKALRDQLYIALGLTDYTRQLLDEAQFAYTYVISSKSGSIFNRKKTYTIHNQEAAQSSINYLETLQAQALGEQAQRNYAIYNLGRNDSIQSAAAHVTDAQSAYNASQALLYGGKSQSALKADIAAKQNEAKQPYDMYLFWMNQASNYAGRGDFNSLLNIKKINNQANYQLGLYEALMKEVNALKHQLDNPTYKYSVAERTQMQQQLEEAKVALINAQQDSRTSLTGTVLSSATLASLAPNNSSLMNMLLGNTDVGTNTAMIQTMLPLLEQAGFKDFNLTKAFAAAQNDPQKLLETYGQQQNILQSASSVYEQLYKDAKSESLNTKLAVEEQMAAFERFQDSFNAYLEIQQQILTNTQTIADIEKQNFSKSMANDLSDALTVFAEAMNQTNKTEIYYQSLSAQEILAKLKAALKESNPANADSLIFAINELEELDLWG